MPQAAEHINLRILKRSRKPARPGDLFVFKPNEKHFYFGRVIKIPELRRDDLLLPPLATNRLPWSRGYFETVEFRPLKASDVLPVHCFRSSTGQCFDETGNTITEPVEPVGEFALQSYRSIDDLVSDALGIKRAF